MKFPPVIIDLESRPDRWGHPIYIGRTENPCSLSFKRGVIFLLFVSEPGVEELRIGTPRPGTQFSSVKRSFKTDGSLDRVHIELEKDTDDAGQVYYRAMVQDDTLVLDFNDGYLFFGFTSKEGAEQLQIVRKDMTVVEQAHKRHVSGEVEVVRYRTDRVGMTAE